MPTADGHPTALISWAHTDPGWTPEQVQTRQNNVLRLAHALHGSGIAVELDLFHLSDAIDWTRWGPQQVNLNDFVLIIASPRWRTAWEGTGDPTTGAGAAAEADALQSMYVTDRSEFERKVRLVLLPDAQDSDIPTRLHGINRFYFTPGDSGDLEAIVRGLTSQPQFALPPLGPLPVLPPTVLDTSGGTGQEQDENTPRALPVPTAHDQPSPIDSTRYMPLTEPVTIQWRPDFAPTQSSHAILAVHILAVPAQPLTNRTMATIATELPRRVRASGVIDDVHGVQSCEDADGVSVLLPSPPQPRWPDVAPPAVQGLRVGRSGQVSVWTTLPHDQMWSLIDGASLTTAIADCLRLAHSAVPATTARVAIAVEIAPVMMVNIGSAASLPRTSGTMTGVGSSDDFRLDPDESVNTQALIDMPAEVAATYADLVLRRWRLNFRV